MVSILIADDHRLLRAGLRTLLNAEPDMRVVGEAADGYTALRLAVSLRPDVLLADISMPGPSGIQVAQELRLLQPSTRVVILTMHEDCGLIQEAARAGACGYIVKRAVEAELIEAIRVVAGGAIYVYGSAQPAALPESVPADPAPAGCRAADLEPIELELLKMLAAGHTTAQIEARLRQGPARIEQLRLRLCDRLGLHSRIELMRFARTEGLL